MDTMDGIPDEIGKLPFVVEASGEADPEFVLCLYTTPMGVKIQCILAAEVDGRALVAFPHQVWHRTIARRALPPGVLSKPTLVELASTTAADRLEMVEDKYIKVWMGYLSAEVYAELRIMEEDEACDYVFKLDGEAGFLPAAASIAEALTEHFSFLNAESGALGDGRGGGSWKAGSQDKAESEHRPRSASGDAFFSYDFQVSGHGSVGRGRSAWCWDLRGELERNAEAACRGPCWCTPLERACFASNWCKAQGEKLCCCCAFRVRWRGGHRRIWLSCQARGPSVALALDKLTEIMKQLSADKLKKASASKIDQALDSAGGGTSSDAAGIPGLKRASAARRALRAALVETPEEVSNVVEKLLMEDMLSQTQAPGMPTPAQHLSARAWLEHRSRVGAYKATAHCAWAACGIWDDLMQGRVAHARATAALLVLQIDQCSVDRGSWTLASELSLEPGPPFASLSAHVAPNVSDGESPFSKLLDPRWSEVMLAHLKEAEDYVTKRRGLGKKAGDDPSMDAARKPKAKAKTKTGSEASPTN